MIDPERLAEAMWEYVKANGYLELGTMDMAFMPDRFSEVAADLAARYNPAVADAHRERSTRD